MKNALSKLTKDIPTLIAIAKVSVIEIKKQLFEKDGNTKTNIWHAVTLGFKMAGHQYSKLEIQTELKDVHTKFIPGKEYVIIILPKDKVGDLGFSKDVYGVYSKK